MRILVAHNFYQQKGGEDGVFDAEADLLESQGHHVIRYTIHNEKLSQMNSIQMARSTVWNPRIYQDLRNLIKQEKLQIAHFHNTFPLISPAAYYAAHAEGIPVVQTLHNYRLLCPNAEFFRAGKVCESCLGQPIPLAGIRHACYRHNRLASTVITAMLAAHRSINTWNKAVDRYIALTPFAQQKFIQGGLPASKIVIKPNFVNPDPGRGDGQGGYALFVGRLSSEKGIGTLLSAWQKLDEMIPLKLIGDGPLASQIAALTQKTSGIDWLGQKTSSEVYKLVRDAAFLVFPSEWYETFGRVAIEAFAAGTPVIGSRIGAIAELIDHGRTGLLFEPGNAEDLANQVKWAIAHPVELAAMRKEARSEFEAKYTAEKNYQQLMKIYQSLL